MKDKKIQIKAKSNAETIERVCDAYVDDNNQIQLEFEKGKVLTRISFSEFNKQLEPLRKVN